MKYVWTVAGDDPDYAHGARYGINGYFWPMFDNLTTRENLQETRSRGYAVGIYLGHDWLQGSGAVVAAKVNEEYKRVAIPRLKVMFNLEEKEPDWIVDVLEEWRKLKPSVSTSWSMEGMQGGWMTSSFVRQVLACKVRVVPQCFTGDMRRRESDVVKADLVRRGFPEHIVSCFYDAQQLGLDWDGFAFTLGRLP